MKRFPVDSTSIADQGYDEQKRTLEVKFRGGEAYQYLHVPPTIYRAFMAAESKGTFLNQRIKPKFRCRKLSTK